jgi:hypothetical protein
MARITTAALDTRLALVEGALAGLTEAVAALVQLGITHEAKPTQDSPTHEPKAAKAKTPHQRMGEENELHGRMFTARYTCTTEGCTNKTGFYKHESALTHAERKGHGFAAIQFAS